MKDTAHYAQQVLRDGKVEIAVLLEIERQKMLNTKFCAWLLLHLEKFI